MHHISIHLFNSRTELNRVHETYIESPKINFIETVYSVLANNDKKIIFIETGSVKFHQIITFAEISSVISPHDYFQ